MILRDKLVSILCETIEMQRLFSGLAILRQQGHWRTTTFLTGLSDTPSLIRTQINNKRLFASAKSAWGHTAQEKGDDVSHIGDVYSFHELRRHLERHD